MGVYSLNLFKSCEELLCQSLVGSSATSAMSGPRSVSEHASSLHVQGSRSYVQGSSFVVNALKPKELASFLYSFAQINHPVTDVCLEAACQYITASLLWAAAKAEAEVNDQQQQQQCFNPQDISNSMWGLSHLDPDSARTHGVLLLGCRQVWLSSDVNLRLSRSDPNRLFLTLIVNIACPWLRDSFDWKGLLDHAEPISSHQTMHASSR